MMVENMKEAFEKVFGEGRKREPKCFSLQDVLI